MLCGCWIRSVAIVAASVSDILSKSCHRHVDFSSWPLRSKATAMLLSRVCVTVPLSVCVITESRSSVIRDFNKDEGCLSLFFSSLFHHFFSSTRMRFFKTWLLSCILSYGSRATMCLPVNWLWASVMWSLFAVEQLVLPIAGLCPWKSNAE